MTEEDIGSFETEGGISVSVSTPEDALVAVSLSGVTLSVLLSLDIEEAEELYELLDKAISKLTEEE